MATTSTTTWLSGGSAPRWIGTGDSTPFAFTTPRARSTLRSSAGRPPPAGTEAETCAGAGAGAVAADAVAAAGPAGDPGGGDARRGASRREGAAKRSATANATDLAWGIRLDLYARCSFLARIRSVVPFDGADACLDAWPARSREPRGPGGRLAADRRIVVCEPRLAPPRRRAGGRGERCPRDLAGRPGRSWRRARRSSGDARPARAARRARSVAHHGGRHRFARPRERGLCPTDARHRPAANRARADERAPLARGRFGRDGRRHRSLARVREPRRRRTFARSLRRGDGPERERLQDRDRRGAHRGCAPRSRHAAVLLGRRVAYQFDRPDRRSAARPLVHDARGRDGSQHQHGLRAARERAPRAPAARSHGPPARLRSGGPVRRARAGERAARSDRTARVRANGGG